MTYRKVANIVKIAPSILAADFSKLGEEIISAEVSGADMIHLDIMDGHFVPNLSFGVAVSAMSKSISPLPHDAHLMVTVPENHIEAFAKAGVEYIVFHIEIDGVKMDLGNNRWVYVAEEIKNTDRIFRLLSMIKQMGCKAGIAINPPSPIKVAFPFLKEIDLLLVMSVNPGFAGQTFIPKSFDKIRASAKFRKENHLNFKIMVDGGVGLENSGELVTAGADILVTGSSFYKAQDRQEFIRKIKT